MIFVPLLVITEILPVTTIFNNYLVSRLAMNFVIVMNVWSGHLYLISVFLTFHKILATQSNHILKKNVNVQC